MKKEEAERYKSEVISKLDENFKNKALEMFKNAKNGNVRNIIEKLSYSEVEGCEARKLKNKTGLDLGGYKHNITNMDVRHIYKNHVDCEKEIKEDKNEPVL